MAVAYNYAAVVEIYRYPYLVCVAYLEVRYFPTLEVMRIKVVILYFGPGFMCCCNWIMSLLCVLKSLDCAGITSLICTYRILTLTAGD